jgi:hypothetical protein
MGDLEKIPEIRCTDVKSKIKGLDLLGPEIKERILKRLSEPTYKSVLRTEEEKWVPVEMMVELIKCVAAEIGEQGIYEWNQKAFNYTIDSSVLGTYMRTASNLFNIQPASVAKLGPFIWKHLYRNCGEMSVEEKGENKIAFVLTDLPPIILSCRAYLLAIGAAFVCLFTFGNYTSQLEIEQPKDTRNVHFIISWNLNIER